MISLVFGPNPNNFPHLQKGLGNYKDLDKTRRKLFPNFACQHLITHTNERSLAELLYGAINFTEFYKNKLN